MSLLYVSLQFLLIGMIAWPFTSPVADVLSLTIFLSGLAVFFAALVTMNLRTFSVMPEPKAEGELITKGIYGIVRHPMYLAVLLCAVGACLAYESEWKWVLTGLLAIVLLLKSQREEKMLARRYPGYAEYRKRTKAIVPFVV